MAYNNDDNSFNKNPSNNENKPGFNGSSTKRIFTLEEQFDLFLLAYESFKGYMNFDELIDYFKKISKGYGDDEDPFNPPSGPKK